MPSQPAEPAVLDSALHTAAKAGDAKKVQGSSHLQMQSTQASSLEAAAEMTLWKYSHWPIQ